MVRTSTVPGFGSLKSKGLPGEPSTRTVCRNRKSGATSVSDLPAGCDSSCDVAGAEICRPLSRTENGNVASRVTGTMTTGFGFSGGGAAPSDAGGVLEAAAGLAPVAAGGVVVAAGGAVVAAGGVLAAAGGVLVAAGGG